MKVFLDRLHPGLIDQFMVGDDRQETLHRIACQLETRLRSIASFVGQFSGPFGLRAFGFGFGFGLPLRKIGAAQLQVGPGQLVVGVVQTLVGSRELLVLPETTVATPIRLVNPTSTVATMLPPTWRAFATSAAS